MTRAALLVALLAACGGAPPNRNGVQRDDAIVQLRSNVRDAQVYVDGRFVAQLSSVRAGIAVEPGFHRFELRHDDYFSSYLELDLARAERKQVQLEMAPTLP